MFPYVAFLWNNADFFASQSALKLQARLRISPITWHRIVSQPGLAVYRQEATLPSVDTVYTLDAGYGVIMGQLFRRFGSPGSILKASAPVSDALDTSESRAIISTKGRSLIENYWGQYVAFLSDQSGRRKWVFRDPTGSVPCYRNSIDNVDVYFLRLHDRDQLDPSTLTVNRHFILGYLAFPGAFTRETGFNEIEAIFPGERIEYYLEDRSEAFVWNPVSIAANNLLEDVEEATNQVARITRDCTHRWASCFDSVGLSLSGGLDSSIVLACLATAPTRPEILGCHFYYPGYAVTDERDYARSVSNHFSVEMAELEVSSSGNLLYSLDLPKALFPKAWVTDPSSSHARLDLFKSRGIEVEFTGIGGDEIYGRGGSLATAVDFAWQHGLSTKLISVAMDDANIGGASLWLTLSQAWRHGIRKHPFGLNSAAPRSQHMLMNKDVVSDARRDLQFLHPLFRDAQHALPPGKMEHAYTLALGTDCAYFPPTIENVPIGLSPLKSQPLLEWGLRVPTYTLQTGGVDRAIARRAFAAELPRKIILRKSKAFGNSPMEILISRNLQFVREMLLDGFLVREGMLNRKSLECLLSGEITNIRSGILELCNYLNVEAWVHSCSPIRTKIAV